MTKDSRVNLRISSEKHEALRKIAESRGVSMSALLEEYINRLIRREKKRGDK